MSEHDEMREAPNLIPPVANYASESAGSNVGNCSGAAHGRTLSRCSLLLSLHVCCNIVVMQK
ncbi:hypothetical protein WBP06_04045 [Novosphingobium sp. BL-8H]|uniref:hypothetical protein n=1 Tax=Novosphingobium sp. BL-8H TaxID=3127640 RepID=UPI00375673D0